MRKNTLKHGTLIYEGNFKDNLREGLETGYYNDGTLEYQKRRKNDVENGFLKVFYKNGTQKVEVNYKDGRVIGPELKRFIMKTGS